MNDIIKDLSFIIAAIIEIGLPIAIAFIIWKKYKVSWAIFFLGMAFFIASLVRLPLNEYLAALIRPYFMGRTLMILSILIPSFTAGLFEEGARALAIGAVIKKRNYEKALMYGIGHGGGGEAMLFVGLQVLISFIIYRFAPHLLPSAALEQFTDMLWYMPLLGAFERIMAIILQISLSVLIMHAFIRRKYYLIGIAILFHTLFNFVAVYVMQARGIVFSELIIFFFALFGLAMTATIFIFEKNKKR